MTFGRLERTAGAKPMSDINVTPLVDVMLVLVVILIITAPLLASSIRLDLPKAEGTQSADAPRFVTLVLPLIAATQQDAGGSLAAAGDRAQQLTRLLRDALHQVLDKLQFGQVLLATVGSTAPFVGLLGTVWGIYHALTSIATAGQITIDRVAGPVGEALIMTAAGLAVAIPAVLGYNIFGRLIHRIEADLEGFARDLRELLTHGPAPQPAATVPA